MFNLLCSRDESAARLRGFVCVSFMAAATLVGSVVIAEESINPSYSPAVSHNYPTNVYWGDTHVHTNLSADAYTLNNRLSPDDAYRLARGERVQSPSGVPIQRRRPLDFLVGVTGAE